MYIVRERVLVLRKRLNFTKTKKIENWGLRMWLV
jgi:hypothetical protein